MNFTFYQWVQVICKSHADTIRVRMRYLLSRPSVTEKAGIHACRCPARFSSRSDCPVRGPPTSRFSQWIASAHVNASAQRGSIADGVLENEAAETHCNLLCYNEPWPCFDTSNSSH